MRSQPWRRPLASLWCCWLVLVSASLGAHAGAGAGEHLASPQAVGNVRTRQAAAHPQGHQGDVTNEKYILPIASGGLPVARLFRAIRSSNWGRLTAGIEKLRSDVSTFLTALQATDEQVSW